jgi:hypothetical protein
LRVVFLTLEFVLARELALSLELARALEADGGLSVSDAGGGVFTLSPVSMSGAPRVLAPSPPLSVAPGAPWFAPSPEVGTAVRAGEAPLELGDAAPLDPTPAPPPCSCCVPLNPLAELSPPRPRPVSPDVLSMPALLPGTAVYGLMLPPTGPAELPMPKLGPALDCASRTPFQAGTSRGAASTLRTSTGVERSAWPGSCSIG